MPLHQGYILYDPWIPDGADYFPWSNVSFYTTVAPFNHFRCLNPKTA